MDNQKEITTVVQKKKKWVVPVISGISVFVLLVACIIVFVFFVANPKRKLSKVLNTGEKYLSELDYDNAILAYEEAISIDPSDESAYLALGRVYDVLADECIEEGNLDDARDYLGKGIKRLKAGYASTGSGTIKKKLDELKTKKESIDDEPVDSEASVGDKESPEENDSEQSYNQVNGYLLDFDILEEVLDKDDKQAEEWLKKNFGSNYKIEVRTYDTLPDTYSWMVEIEGTRKELQIREAAFSWDYLALDFDSGGPVSNVSIYGIDFDGMNDYLNSVYGNMDKDWGWSDDVKAYTWYENNYTLQLLNGSVFGEADLLSYSHMKMTE